MHLCLKVRLSVPFYQELIILQIIAIRDKHFLNLIDSYLRLINIDNIIYKSIVHSLQFIRAQRLHTTVHTFTALTYNPIKTFHGHIVYKCHHLLIYICRQ